MAKIIIEDMKVNKRRSQTIIKKETISNSNIPDKYFDQKKITKPLYSENYDEVNNKEIVKEKEKKINEYFKNRSSNKQRLQRTPQARTKSKLFHKPVLIIFVLCLIIGGIYWSGNIFQKANISITFKHQVITYDNKQFVASKNPSDNSVNFEIMITSDKKLKNIILTESKDVSIKAKGGVILYNEFKTTPQKLLAGTFLIDNNGKTYKTDSVVTIPGYKIDVNKKIIPGQIVADISSFLPGDSYNGSPTDFYINSFKGTAKYDKIYGKLQSSLVGGATGLMYLLDDVNKSNVDKIAQTSFKEDLLKQVKALVPPGYILYPDATNFSYKIGNNILSKTPNVEIEIEGSLSVVLLQEKSLIDNIIKISLPGISSDEFNEIKIPDLSKLSFSFTNKDQLITKDMNSVSFFLSGDIDAIWNPNEETLKMKLLGVNKNAVLPIFQQDKGISSALVKIFPPWYKYIPNDLSKINIITL